MANEWNTRSEIEFLKNVGSHAKIRRPHLVALRAYHNAMSQRHRWGQIDPVIVAMWVRRRIDTLEAKALAAAQRDVMTPRQRVGHAPGV
jgi:hypothetical protein